MVLSRLLPAALLILSVGLGVVRPLPRTNVRTQRHAGVNRMMASAEPTDGNDGAEQRAARVRGDAPRWAPLIASAATLVLLVLRTRRLARVPVMPQRRKLPIPDSDSLHPH